MSNHSFNCSQKYLLYICRRENEITVFARDTFLNIGNSSRYFTPTEFNLSLNRYTQFKFYPPNLSALAVQPVGQTELRPLMIGNNNIPMDGQVVAILSNYNPKIILKVNTVFNYSTAIILNSTKQVILNPFNEGDNISLWYWADYYKPTSNWFPDLEIYFEAT